MGISARGLKKAVFLDRDGVLCSLVWRRKDREYGAALNTRQLRINPVAASALKRMQDLGFALFVISNQPDYAKGLTSLKNIRAVNKGVRDFFCARGVRFAGYFYCLHHPQAAVSGYRKACACRKPGPLLALAAKKKYRLDMASSWFIGDCDSDVLCGKAAGTKTILIEEKRSKDKRGKSDPDFFVKGLKGALRIIKREVADGRIKKNTH